MTTHKDIDHDDAQPGLMANRAAQPQDHVALETPNAWTLLCKATFNVGGDDRLATLRTQFATEPTGADEQRSLAAKWGESLRDARVRLGTLLKSETVSFLLGAGASKEVGGVLIGSLPIEIEQSLLHSGVSAGKVRGWVKLFYAALQTINPSDASIPHDRPAILQRAQGGAGIAKIAVNLESLLTLLYRWRAALPPSAGRLRIDAAHTVIAKAEELDQCIRETKRALAAACSLPTANADTAAFDAYKDLLKKLLTRPLNLKRVNIFTLNYDTLVEQAADATGVVVLDGFVGTIRRYFRPESYDHDLYFPAETTEGRVHRLDRVIHLYKLHGSLTWRAESPSMDNPYGIAIDAPATEDMDKTLIYPTPAKFGETLGMPYAELFRRFANAVVRPQSTLVVIGYGFGDDHVNAIIRQALAVPSFTLVIVDPYPTNGFVRRLTEQQDQRVWLFGGETLGGFSAFVNSVLPDLRDEAILRKVIETHRALATDSPKPAGGDGDAE